MKYSSTILFAANAAVANAQRVPGGDALLGVCQPLNSSQLPDMNAPCNAIQAIQGQCIYGPAWLDMYNSGFLGKRQNDNDDNNNDDNTNSDDNNDDPTNNPTGTPQNPSDEQTQSNETQRICLCQSEFWSLAGGCFNCYKVHGGAAFDDPSLGFDSDLVTSISSAYCAVSATATAGLADVLFSYAASAASSVTSTASTPTSFSDPIGNRTEVSYYYTGSVTGTAAWIVAQPTGESGVVSYTATSTEDGQIVATAEANNDEVPSGTGPVTETQSGTGANPTESGNAASRREVVAAAGLCGFFGIVAFVL